MPVWSPWCKRQVAMKEYKVTDPIELYYGSVGLTEKQAELRRDKVRAIEGEPGMYAVLSTISFKAGEIIRIAPEKGLLTKLELVKPQARKEKTVDL